MKLTSRINNIVFKHLKAQNLTQTIKFRVNAFSTIDKIEVLIL
jgi:hypothetical protein